MSEQAKPAAGPDPESAKRELASRIYVELVARVMLTSDQNKPNPADLAKYCYKLAEAFQSVEEQAKQAALAKSAKYDVKVDDITSWKK